MKKKKPELTEATAKVNVEAEVIPFCVTFKETQDGMEIEIVDDLTKFKTTIKEEKLEKNMFDSNFDMFSIGRWVIKILKPKFREIVSESKKV